MLLASSPLIIFKVTTALAKEMVYSETTKRVVPSIFQAGRQWLLDSLANQRVALNQQTPEDDNDDDARSSRETIEKRDAEASTEYLVHNWLEALFGWFQVIVLWHEPHVSICALSGLLTSFLLLTYFAPRIYATIMIALFIYNANKFWFRYVWPTIRVPPSNEREQEMRLDVDRWTYLHPQLMTLAELGHYTSNLMQISELYLMRLLKLRQERPVYFCSIICSILSFTAYIGNTISGVSLLFIITTALVSAPGIYLHLLPNSMKHWIKQNIGLRIIKNINELNQSPNDQHEIRAESESLASQPPPPPSSSSSIAAPIISLLEKSPQTIKQEASQTISSLTSTAARTIETQALSLFEHFKRKSFTSRSESETSESLPDEIKVSKLSSSSSSSIESDEQRPQPQPEVSLDKQELSSKKDIGAPRSQQTNNRKGSDDMSSNDSVSLIDSDEDGEGGFVML